MSVVALLLLAAVPVESFAVVVGENRPVGTATQHLSYADDDAVMTHQLLKEAGVHSSLLVKLDEDSAALFGHTHVTAAPTRKALLSTLQTTFEQISRAHKRGRKTRFYFVYSGHGDVVDGEGYVALRDAKLTRTFLHEQILARSPADENHVIVDACRSYFLAFGKGPGGQRRTHNLALVGTQERFPNTGFVLSTSSDRDSHEWARYRGGIFSHEVRSALRGGADVDLNARISYAELGAFVETANRTLPNSRYRPDAVIMAPRIQDIDPGTLLVWGESDTLLVMEDASLGHMVLENHDGVRLADAHPAPGQLLLLRTPTSRPLFLRDFDNTKEYIIDRSGPAVLLSRSRSHPPAVVGRGPAHLAFRLLFRTPFDSASVHAFDRPAAVGQVAAMARAPTQGLLPRARAVTPWVSLGAVILGGALTTTALVDRGRAAQVDVNATNTRIVNYNRGAAGAYSLAVVSGLVWLGIELLAPDGLFSEKE